MLAMVVCQPVKSINAAFDLFIILLSLSLPCFCFTGAKKIVLTQVLHRTKPMDVGNVKYKRSKLPD